MTHTLTHPTPREPVMVTIARRPPEAATPTLPVPITPPPIGEDEFRIIDALEAELIRVNACSCTAGDDQPY